MVIRRSIQVVVLNCILLLQVHSNEIIEQQDQYPLEYIGRYTNIDSLEKIFWENHIPLVIIGDNVYRANSLCCALREINGDIETRKLSGDEENRGLSGDIETRKLSGDEENRGLSGDIETRKLSGDEEDRRLSGDEEDRRLSGDEEDRRLSGDSESRSISGDDENRTLAGDVEGRGLSGDFETRKIDGDISAIDCEKIANSTSFKLLNVNENARIKVYDIFGLRAVNGLIIEYY